MINVASTVHYINRERMMPNDDEKLKIENPLRYYLNHINDMKIMAELLKENRLLYHKVHRIDYILSFKTKEPLRKCPKCGNPILTGEWGEEYCQKCGVITRNNYPYMAGIQHDLPYGLKL